jgi:hypothetical protein
VAFKLYDLASPGPWAGPLLARLGWDLPLTTMKIPVYYWPVDHFLTHTWSYEGMGMIIMTIMLMIIMTKMLMIITVSPSARLMYGEYWFRLSRLSMMVIGSFASYTKTKSVESAV